MSNLYTKAEVDAVVSEFKDFKNYFEFQFAGKGRYKIVSLHLEDPDVGRPSMNQVILESKIEKFVSELGGGNA